MPATPAVPPIRQLPDGRPARADRHKLHQASHAYPAGGQWNALAAIAASTPRTPAPVSSRSLQAPTTFSTSSRTSWLFLCHQGTESPATASPDRPYPQGIWGYPEQPVRSRIPSQPTDQSAGQARTGTVTSRDCLDAQVTTPPGRAPEPHDGMVRRGQRQPGAVSCQRAGRRGSPRPRSRPGYTPRARATSGQCRVPVSYMRVWMTCSSLGPGWPSASPVSRRHSRGCSCGAAGRLRLVPRPVSGKLDTKATVSYVTSAMAITAVCVNHAGRYLAGRALQG